MMVLLAMLLELASKQTMMWVYGIVLVILLVLLFMRRKARVAKR